MATIQMVQGDTSPSYTYPLLQSDGKTPVDLTGATVRFRIKDPDTLLEVNSNANNTMVITGAATLGIVVYNWNATDLPAAKNYQADVEITFPSTKVGTLFEQVIIQVRAKN